jgi:hypothetical protein
MAPESNFHHCPLVAILPERGIVLGLEPEIAIHKPKSIAMFKMATKVHLAPIASQPLTLAPWSLLS